MKKLLPLFILAGLFITVAGAIIVRSNLADSPKTDSSKKLSENDLANKEDTTPNEVVNGRYTSYSNAKRANKNYKTNILFFFASWCPECRAFKQALTKDELPPNTQILEVNYDSSTELKQKYGVTLQSTFVLVNNDGDSLSKWVGYGKTKTLNTVLKNLN